MELKGIPHSQLFLTVADLSKILPYSKSTVNRQINRGVWGSYSKPPGGSKFISKEDFIRKLEEYTKDPKEFLKKRGEKLGL